MSEMPSFQPGQTVLVREVWADRIWWAGPMRVIKDTQDMIALFMQPGTLYKLPVLSEGQRVTAKARKEGNWQLVDSEWQGRGYLRLIIPGSNYSVMVFWTKDYCDVIAWYINLEEPFRHTSSGFEYCDLILDIVVEADLSNWRWKDEDDFEEARKFGIISPEKAAFLYSEGERVVKWLQSGKSPFNSWENWRPDLSWEIPVLPDDWDIV